jgi:hypothetical protein
MRPRQRLVLLLLIMVAIVVMSEALTLGILYHTALTEERARLEETARSQARLIDAVARFDAQYRTGYPDGARHATLAQIREAHAQYQGFGATGEFTLATREGDQIVFLLRHRHAELDVPTPVPWHSALAEPMRRALAGRSGTVIGLDYRGEKVLAAHEPVPELNAGIVAKIDLAEIRAPFITAALLSASLALVLIGAGAGVFLRLTEPLLRHLRETVAHLEHALREVKTLRGIVPICAYCKKIRNDQGYWDQVDVYVRAHTEADFSHGICPTCLNEHFPELKGTSGITP